MTGDWDDAVSAARIAASRAELAILAVHSTGPGETTIDLLSIGDRPASVVLRRLGPDKVEATCRIGRWGDAEREGRFLDALAYRLSELVGVEFAPAK